MEIYNPEPNWCEALARAQEQASEPGIEDDLVVEDSAVDQAESS